MMLREHMKGQLMTLVMLVIFILLLAELFAFALLNINSNSVAQSLTVSSSSSNYGNLLKLSANNFAYASLGRALTALATYESTPSYRKSNFVSNTSQYLSYLITNGVLPNDASGYPENAMGNLTLKLYNASIANVIGYAAQSVAINETQPVIFQTDPYHVRVSYIENIAINSSGNNYRYSIPVNTSVPLNSTPDLFYAQQGAISQMRFASISNLTYVLGGTTASSGNVLSYGYGTVYWLQSNTISGAACSSIPAGLSGASVSGNIILATYNAIGLESCENSYAGLIAYIAPSTLPTVPYLIYPSSSGFLRYIPTGTRALIYGPLLETLNIEALRNAIVNGYYFASPFTPSYLSRAQANFNNQSLNGIFTFSNYNTQAGNFNGAGSYVTVPLSSALAVNTFTVSAWIYQPSISSSGQVIFGANQLASCTGYVFMVNPYGSASGAGRPGIGGECTASVQAASVDAANTWYLVTGTYDGSTYKIYVNGAVSNTLAYTQTFSSQGNFFIGELQPGSNLFNGHIANLQVYNSALAAQQIQSLYQEGILGLPISGNLVGWWPLNGNAQDYSGQGNNGKPTSVSYSLLQNYSRDSILNVPVSTPISPIPGLLSCTLSSGCASNTLPNMYLGTMPLESQGGQVTAMFNPLNSYIKSKSALPAMGQATILWWTDVNSVVTQGAGMGPSACQIYEPTASGSTFTVNFDPCSCTGYSACSSNAALSPPTNQWVMVEYVINGNVINGYAYFGTTILHSSTTLPTTSFAIPSLNFYIESYAGNPIYNHFSGNVLNVQVYNTPLTPTQTNTLYQSGAYGLPFATNLIAWWPLSGDARDYSGNGYNGITVNVIYPGFAGTYNAPGLSTIATTASEWQALGLSNPP
ncbi:MAG: laminin G domain-containing protein [Candidatus Micrarchaeota archaeon]|nr:laminin G domain-containing protein [Candidatus Micrarchaeota archaeon]